MMTLIGIQDRYIQTLLGASRRWAHRPGHGIGGYRFGGHFPRTARGARKAALADLRALGFSDAQAEQAVTDAKRMYELELLADEQ
jgi:hypothetical protein